MKELVAAIRIKGMRDGLLVSLPEGEWDGQRSALLAQIDSQESFFRGARLALDVGSQVVKVNEMVELRDRLSERGVSLWAVIGESAVTEQTAQLSLDAAPVSQETALYLRRTLRSGTRIEFPGSIVVLGDVNPGAELVAHGSLIIWGRLRGSVHAGAAGDLDAVVCALELAPMRLQIGGEELRRPAPDGEGNPAMAVLRNGEVVQEAWQPAGTGAA